MKYDLEERLLLFSKNLINFLKDIEKNIISQNIIMQLLKSGTSIGANYREANGAISRKDFKYKIFICRKEAKETVYRLDVLEVIAKDMLLYIELKQEAKEINLIFNKIAMSLNE